MASPQGPQARRCVSISSSPVSKEPAGTEQVGSIVLWPQVVKEAALVPVLAAVASVAVKQIAAALALGTQGAWTGLQWLMARGSRKHRGSTGRIRQGDQPC